MWHLLLLGLLASTASADVACDCGVRWKPLTSPSGTIYVLSQALARDVQSAKNHAYTDIDVDGLLVAQTTQTSPAGTTYRLVQLYATTAPMNGRSYLTTTFGAYTGYDAHRINRHQQYRCFNNRLLNVTHYYFTSGARSDIEMFNCPYRLNDGVTCCWKNGGATCPEPTSFADSALLDARFINQTTAHWLARGHMYRYAPNAQCLLTPTIWDPATSCATTRPGCFDISCDDNDGHNDDNVCSGHGYCVESPGGIFSSTTHACQCYTFDDPHLDNADFLADHPLLAHTAQYGLRDCSQNLAQEVEGEQANTCGTNMCGTPTNGETDAVDRPGACVATVNLDSVCPNWDTGVKQFQAACDCDGTAFNGDYCLNSRCNNGDGCTDGHFQSCSATEEDPDVYECVCGTNPPYYGDACEYSARTGCCDANPTTCTGGTAPDAEGDDTLVCSGHGTPTHVGDSCVCVCEADRVGTTDDCFGIACHTGLVNQTYLTANQKATCDHDTGLWTCHTTWNTTRNSTGGTPFKLCDRPRCPNPSQYNSAHPDQCACPSGYINVDGDYRCYQACPNNCGAGTPVYNPTTLTCTCDCGCGRLTTDPVFGCSEYCRAPYALPTGSGTGAARYYSASSCFADGTTCGGTQCACATCNSSYTGAGCRTDVNECASHPCQNAGTCHNFEGGYSCSCRPGYTGSRCQTAPEGTGDAGGGGASGGGASSSTAAAALSSSSTGVVEEEEPTNSSSSTGEETIVGPSSSSSGVLLITHTKSKTAFTVGISVGSAAVGAVAIGVLAYKFSVVSQIAAWFAKSTTAVGGIGYGVGKLGRGIRSAGRGIRRAVTRSRSKSRGRKGGDDVRKRDATDRDPLVTRPPTTKHTTPYYPPRTPLQPPRIDYSDL